MKTIIPGALCAACVGVQLAGNQVDGFVSVVTAGESHGTVSFACAARFVRVDGVGPSSLSRQLL